MSSTRRIGLETGHRKWGGDFDDMLQERFSVSAGAELASALLDDLGA
jgi:hypothetical protein